MRQPLTILGLESSCDDTGAAVIRGDGQSGEILSNIVLGQTDLHEAFGGVVPEIAARAHAELLDHAIEKALAEAGKGLLDIDALAVTAGPGLIGGVMSGLMYAKAICAATGKPLVAVNHLAGHALSPRLSHGLAYPYLLLLVSGGHCQFLAVLGPSEFRRLGGTIDDAPGEAFDKVARLLSLEFPGGPAIEREARAGDPARFDLPRPLLDRDDCNMSFSGLKTAVRRHRDTLMADTGSITHKERADLCAGFQAAVVDVLVAKTGRAINAFRDVADPDNLRLSVAGGVASNTAIRAALTRLAAQSAAEFCAPPPELCTDNAAMIAWAGLEQFLQGASHGLDVSARPRWPLDDTAAPMLGSGKKGAKA